LGKKDRQKWTERKKRGGSGEGLSTGHAGSAQTNETLPKNGREVGRFRPSVNQTEFSFRVRIEKDAGRKQGGAGSDFWWSKKRWGGNR